MNLNPKNLCKPIVTASQTPSQGICLTIILTIGLFLTVTGCSLFTSKGDQNIDRSSLYQPLTEEQQLDWKQDLLFLFKELEARHFNLFHSRSKESLKAHLSQIISNLDQMNHFQLMTSVMGFTQSIGDGHTMSGWWNQDYFRYPIEFRLIEGDWRVIKISEAYPQILGSALVSIEDQPIKEITKQVGAIAPTSAENSHARTHAIEFSLNVSDILIGLGITKNDKARFKFKKLNGSTETVSVQSTASNSKYDYLAVKYSKNYSDHFTYYKVQETDGLELYSLHQNQTAYLNFSGYPGYWSMYWFADEMLDWINENQTRQLIIDLRENGGGNFFEGLLLAQFLVLADSLDWSHGIYVLTSNRTFSAGASNAAQFKQILNATVVGQVTGGNPYGIQDGDSFYLPKSGWSIMYSKRIYRFQDNFTKGLIPDVPIEPSWDAFMDGKDEELGWVISKLDHLLKGNEFKAKH